MRGFVAALAVMFVSMVSGGQSIPVVFVLLAFGLGFAVSWFGERKLEAAVDAWEDDERQDA